MSKLIIEHLTVGELPECWARKLDARHDQKVTVRIQTEPVEENIKTPPHMCIADDPAFGIWRDHDATAQVGLYSRKLRASRY